MVDSDGKLFFFFKSDYDCDITEVIFDRIDLSTDR